MNSEASNQGTMDYRKKVTCRFWKKGFCMHGEECPFLHGLTTRTRKQKQRTTSKFKGYMQETHMNEETQNDEFWEQVEDSGDRSRDSWDGCDQGFGEAEEYSDHWGGVNEDAIAALLGGSSTWSEEAHYREGQRKPKKKAWSGPKRQKPYPHELENEDFRIAKDVERFLRRERNRIENIVGIAKDKYDDREFESSSGSPIFGSEYGNFGSTRGQISPRNSRHEEPERFDRSPDRFCGSPSSSRHRSLERQNYSSPNGYDCRSPYRSRHKITDRGRYRSHSRSSSPVSYVYKSPDRSRNRSADQDSFITRSGTRYLTPDRHRSRSPDRVRDWSHENMKHNSERARGRDLENDRPGSSEQSKSGRHLKSRLLNPEQPQYLSHERLDSRSPDTHHQRNSERLGHRSQERVRHRSPERPRLRSLERGRHWSPERRRHRSPERSRHRSHDRLKHKNPERATYRSPRRGRQRSPKRQRVNSPERNQHDDLSKELKQSCTNYKLILHRYESPVQSESSSSDYQRSCSRSSSRDENHLNESASKELSNVSHSKEPTCSQSEGPIQNKVSVSEEDLELFEKRILSNCKELLASLKDPSKIGELLNMQDKQISAELCKGNHSSEVVSQSKDTSTELSSPQARSSLPLTKVKGNSSKESKSAKQDHDPYTNTSQPAYDKIKIVVDCKKTENKIVASTDTARQVVLMEGGKDAINDISEKDSEQSKLSQNLHSEESERPGNEFLKDSDAKESNTCISEEAPRQTRRVPGFCNKQERSFREEEDNYESVVEEVSQELDDVLEALKEIEDSDDCEEEPQKCYVELQDSTEKALKECAADIVSSLKEDCGVQSELSLISATDCNTDDAQVKSMGKFKVGENPSETGLRSSSKTLVKVSPMKLNCDSDEKKPFAKVQPYSVTYLRK